MKSKMYSVHPNDEAGAAEITLEQIDTLADGINSNLNNLLEANKIILRSVVADNILGRAHECIISNVNTEYDLVFNTDVEDEDYDEEKAKTATKIIKKFNEIIDLNSLIRDAVDLAWLEGNYVLCLRTNDDGGAIVDHYPLSIAYPSDYKINGNPVIEFDVNILKDRLSKTYKRTKKRKAIYFENIKKEIQENFPPAVYDAFTANEQYARLDANYTGCIKVGNNGRKFGVSPFFRCLKPLVVLSNIEAADVSSSKTRSKKIIFQKLRKELMGSEGLKKGFAEQAHAHQQAAQALKTNFCLYTAPAYVESLEYVTDNTPTCDPDTVNLYNSKLLTSLGIGFSDNNISNFTVAKISVEQMLRTINSITEQLEAVLERFYKTILNENGIEPKYAPKLNIIDSEQLDYSLRKEMATFIYGTLNCSLETTLKMVGIDIEDEKKKRQKENDNNIDKIFYARQTAYTTSGESGRPPTSEDEAKQEQDKEYNNG